MEDRTIENLVDYIVLEKLKEQIVVDAKRVFEPLADDSKSLADILRMVFESKRYNSIITDDMVLYVFGEKEQDIKDFIDWAMGQIRDDDECWGTWIYCNGKSAKLNSFIDKEIK